MNLFFQFEKFVEENRLFEKNDHLLLAVSGGLDSVVLSELCFSLGSKITLAHCNFQLRGEESERDEEFVQSLGKKYGAAILVKKFETESYASAKKVSVQVAARELRYTWFNELIEEGKAKWILTAHHLDDNVETVLMNFFKSTGLSGMRGILSKSGKIVRPLLFARKEELLAYAKERGLQWVEDSSNESDKYSRNYLRHQLIPIIEKLYPTAIENLGNNIDRFREIEQFHREAVQQQLKKLVEMKGEEVHIPILKLKKSPSVKTLLYELINRYGFSPDRINEVVQLLESESGKYKLSASHRILKNRNWLIISPLNTELQQQVLLEKGDDRVAFQQGQISIRKKPVTNQLLHGNNGTALLDAEKINFPLLVRKWKPGDYFYPLGMRKKKKLARFFIDQKLSLAEKEKVWVVEMNKKIIWVIGMRIDDRFKITDGTQQVMEINFDQKVLNQ